MTTVRTRIAPSPTGDPHVGTAYIALFNLCFARQHGGKFILRIEDTDQVRSTRKSENDILAALKWLNLDWDEGPDKGGPHAPYRQSERSAIYHQHAQQLLDRGYAFRCFCTSERLDSVRKQQLADKQQVGYDGHCMHLTQEDIATKLASGFPYVIRMKVPREGKCVIDDLLREPVEIEWSQVDMQVLMKSDGLPTYHLANVVDDHLMEITHVLRGEEWISSAPKHLLLYQYFGWQAPVLCHLPLLRNPDKSKLSKRKNPTSIGYYQRMGYLPEAVINYLGMMGWSMPDGNEKFSLREMIAQFDIKRVSLGGPVFDTQKLDWLNGRYVRESLSDEEFIARYAAWAFDPRRIRQIVPLVKPRVERFADVMPLSAFFLSAVPSITLESFANNKLTTEDSLRILQFVAWRIEEVRDWQRDALEQALVQLAQQMNMKIRELLFPLFIAIAGTAVSVSVIDAMAIVGLDMSRARIRHALTVLGGISGKQQKVLEKE
ncbi:MAG TPA: glutamate--tRNA ligase, partial [Candidatus Acidoferrum sp.]|nr:glutamate--tRNA ligase [Candidatus Acidoferrum sp.]